MQQYMQMRAYSQKHDNAYMLDRACEDNNIHQPLLTGVVVAVDY
jgi:hypothetical protein